MHKLPENTKTPASAEILQLLHAMLTPYNGQSSQAGDAFKIVETALQAAVDQGGVREAIRIPDDLREAAKYASDGPWEVDSEWNADGAYGGGPGHGTGYDDYLILDAQGRTLFGSENSTAKAIEEEYDEDGGTAWHQVGKRNAAFIVGCVNFVRAALTGGQRS